MMTLLMWTTFRRLPATRISITMSARNHSASLGICAIWPPSGPPDFRFRISGFEIHGIVRFQIFSDSPCAPASPSVFRCGLFVSFDNLLRGGLPRESPDVLQASLDQAVPHRGFEKNGLHSSGDLEDVFRIDQQRSLAEHFRQ